VKTKRHTFKHKARLATIVGFVAFVAIHCTAQAAEPRTHVVCTADSRASGCQYRGDAAIQAAVDRAKGGDTILIKAGRYAPVARRDVPYKDFIVRGYVVVDGKELSIVGEPGVVLDGGAQLAAAAIVVRNATVTLRNLEITGFRYEVEEDDYYEGHGIFVIDGRVRIEDVTIRNFQKMGLTGRGDTLLDVSRLKVLDGHVGIWLHETAHLRLRDSIVRGNDSAAIAAYENSVAHVSGSVFEANRDDGLYTEQQAAIYAIDCRILRNKPFGAHATQYSRIWLERTELSGNEKETGAEGSATVRVPGGA
jgi:hypothetical protein